MGGVTTLGSVSPRRIAQYLIVTAHPLTGTPALERLQGRYPVHRIVTDAAWLVLSEDPNETARTVSESIFPRAPGETSATPIHSVFLIGSWWGFADRELWEWLDRTKGRSNG
jgi:hypothetical protein